LGNNLWEGLSPYRGSGPAPTDSYPNKKQSENF